MGFACAPFGGWYPDLDVADFRELEVFEENESFVFESDWSGGCTDFAFDTSMSSTSDIAKYASSFESVASASYSSTYMVCFSVLY